MAATNYKNKKGSTGKKYTTYGDRIKVTYTDGSTRVVRPSDASYNATKKAMESDIANRKLIGNKRSNTTAETALGAGNKDTSLIASATVNDKAKEATQKRKADQAASDKTMKASERASVVNQYAAMNAHKTAQSAAKKAPETIGYSIESGHNQFAGGLQAAPYIIAQDLLTTFKGKNASIDNVKNPLRPNQSLGDTLRAIAARQAQQQNEIQQKYGYDDFSGGQKLAAELGSGIANMAPAFLLAPISGGASLAAMGITAAGSAANKALNEGASLQDASTYGIRSGAIEAGTELIGGGIPLLPSILKGGKVAAKVGGTAGKVLGHAADIGTEGAEEAMSEALDPWNQRTSYNPDAQNATAEELARAALLGSLTSGTLKGVAGGVNLANTARQPKDITPKLVKAGQNVRQEQNNAQNEQQNFQTTQKNQIANAENAQNGMQQLINNQTINPITNQNNAPQNETSQADFPQTQQNPKDIRPILKRPTPEPTIPMEQRNFDNVKDKNVLAYQQEHPEVKPYQQAVANQLLADLDMGVKGGRDVGIDPETRNVTQRGGWQRQQSEPVNKMLDDGLSYAKIRKGLNDIVEDNGKENNTTAKRVELYVNDAVVNGYNSITEGRVEQNNAYHYRGMSREQLLTEQSRLENNFTGNIETDNAIIRELETIDGLLQQMSGQKAQPVNNDITPELQTAKHAQQQNQQQEPTISDKETVADESQSDSYKDYDVSQLPKDVFDFYNQVGEVGGKARFNIRFVQNLEHDAEGRSDGNGNILISAERANDIETLRRVVAHECYHAMKSTDQWKDIQDLAYELYKLENPNGTQEQMLQAKIDQYYKRSGGKVQLDKEGAWDEVGAELMGEILSDPKMADRIWNQNPTLAQRITRWLEDMVQKLHDFVFEVEAEDSIYKQAFEAYSEGLRSMRWQGGAQSESRYSIDSNLKAQFDNWMQGYMNENDYFNLGDTPKSLTVFGAKTLPMVMTQDVLVKVTGGKHSIALDELSKLPDQIANPVMLFKGSVPNSFVVLTEMQDKSGKEVITAIHLKRYQNRMQVNRIASVYGKDNIVGYVNGNLKAGNLLDVDTKKAPTWFTSRGLQLPKLVQTIIDAKNNIPQNQQEGNAKTDIRYSFSSKKLPNQKYLDQSDENLRNFMEGSAVVNEDGTPKVVYSGHANTNLFGSKFDIKKATSGGFYFTESPEIASSYAEDKLGVMEQYEDGSEYRFYDEKGNPTRRISDVRLTPEQIDIFENKLSDEDDGILGMTYPEYLENVAKYNDQLKWLPRNKYSLTLADIYNIFDQEGLTIHYNKKRSQFEDLLQEFGLEWDSYLQKKQGVFPVYLSIKNPIDTSKPIPLALMGAFEREAAKDRKTYTFDQLDRLRWTADYPMKQWVEDIRRDQENGTAGWSTTIPKKARKIMLEMGYDGIKDTGGKMGGVEHEVWIAFEPNQIKSAIGNRGTFDPTKKDIRYSLNNKDVVGSQEYKDLLDEHGSMPEGENPTGENYRVEVPRRTAKGNKTRQFVRNVMEASTIDDVTANMTAEELINGTGGDLVHEPLANKAVVDAVNERIANNGWEREYDELHKDIAAGNRVTAEDVTMGIRAIQEAQKAGDYKAAAQMVTDLAIAGTELGQSVQAYTLLKRLTPEGQLLALKRVQQRINKNLVKQGKKPVSEMSEETMIEFLEARGETKRSDIWNREIARMGQETEGTWADKINAVRYTAMLCNPKTHIKNIISNIAMTAARQPTIAISAALEDARRVKDKALHPGGIAPEQYRSLHNRTGQKYSELKKYAEMNYKTFAKDVLQSGGNRYQNVSSAFENNKRIFGNSLPGRVLEQLAGSGKYSVSSALEAEDMMFKHRTYVSSLVGYMKANGITTKDAALRTVKPNGASIEKGEQYALQQAKKATFTEDNKLANALTNFENLNAGTKLFMGGFMPYKRTPMNILTRGVEYSPAGLIMTGYKMVYAMSRKTGNSFGDGSGYNMNDVFESLGANMTGSAIMTLGILLAREGFLAGAGDEDDERKRKYNQQMGDQNYAVVNPETGDSYTIDWLAPVAMPLFAGVEVYNRLSGKYDVDDETNTARIIEAIGKIADPVFEMSFMQGVANALASYSGDTGDIASTVGSTIITGYAGQFIPSVVGAAARTIDDTVRSSYAPKSSSLTKKGESFLRQQRSKIPFASMQNEASIDVWGNERKREGAGDGIGDVAFRAFNNFVNPGNYSSNKRTSLDNELERLYQSTGDSGIFPAVASGTINESQQNPKISMTPLEFSKFSTTKGKKSQQYVSDFVNSEAYDQLDDSEKADIISSLYSLATYEARKQVLTDPLRGYNYSQEDYENVLGSGVKPYEYYSTKKRFGGKWATYETVAKYAEHADRMGMDDAKYVEMNEDLNNIKADKKNGKSVSGSREKKVRAYLDDELNAGNITAEQWWYWYAMEYSSKAKNSPYEWQWTLHDNTDSTSTQQSDKDKANQGIQYATMLTKPNR